MAAIDDITDLAQDVYISINGAENDDDGEDLVVFQNTFIRNFNLWVREFETEAYWNVARVNDYELGVIANTDDYSFELPADYRTPIFEQNKDLKFVLDDGTIVARFRLVDPNQRQVDQDIYRPDRATFLPAGQDGGGTVVLSRAPREEELGATMVLDVVRYFPKLTRDVATVLTWIPNRQISTLGVAKNQTLADLTKVSLSPSFAQKYNNELNKAIAVNNASNEVDEMQGEDGTYAGMGIW